MVGGSRPGVTGHPRLLALGAALLPVLVLMRRALFSGEVLYRRDVTMQWVPHIDAFVRCVGGGSWPWWDPWIGFGQPLLADPRREVLYPFTWLNLLVPVGPFMTFFVATHLVLGALGVHALARHLGASRWAAMVAGIAWVSSGPVLTLTAHWHHLAGAVWIPWIFLFADRTLMEHDTRSALLLCCSLALQVFAGSPDYTLLMVPALALLLVSRLASLHRQPPDLGNTTPVLRVRAPERVLGSRGIRAVVLAGALAVALCAAQWLPTIAWTHHASGHHAQPGARSTWAIHPVLLSETVFAPRWADLPLSRDAVARLLDNKESFLLSSYFGPVAFALALTGLVVAGWPRVWLGVVALGSLVYALGTHTFFWGLTLDLWPPLRLMRFPAKALVLTLLAASLLLARGLDAVATAPARRSARLVFGCGLAVAALIALLWMMGLAEAPALGGVLLDQRFSAWPQLRAHLLTAALGTWVVVAVAFVAVASRSAGRWKAVVLGACVVAPTWVVHRNTVDTAPGSFHDMRPSFVDAIGDPAQARVYAYDYERTDTWRLDTNPGLQGAPYRVGRVPAGDRWTPLAAAWLGAVMDLTPPTAARWGLAGSFDLDVLDMEPSYSRAIKLALRAEEASPVHTRFLRMAAVTHATSLSDAVWTRDLTLIRKSRGYFVQPMRLFAVPQPLPRAFLVHTAQVLDDRAALTRLEAPDFDPAVEAVLAQGRAVAQPRDGRDAVRVIEHKPDRVVMDARLDHDGYLVVTDAYDDGWTASVDGRPAPIVRANLAFRAVLLGPGRHRVELVYRPAAILWGFAVSAGAVLALPLLVRVTRGHRPADA